MKDQFDFWKATYRRLGGLKEFDCPSALSLVADIQKSTTDPILRAAAAQALPGLRLACAAHCSQGVRTEAENRFRNIGQVLDFASQPRFGRRNEESSAQPLSFEESCRMRLGLPSDRRLFGPEINQAYKREAKLAHPDAGGNDEDFLALIEARDALLKAI